MKTRRSCVITRCLAAAAFCATLAPASELPTVYLSHVFIVLDKTTYDALNASPDIASFAAVQEKHTETSSGKWTGFYITGRQTYLEFFDASSAPEGMHLGDVGLALTVEKAGGVKVIAERWRTKFGDKVELDTTQAKTDSGAVIPWFEATDVKASGPDMLSTWAMEIDPGFLAANHAGERVDHPLGREQYLSWKFDRVKPLDNISGITLALGPSESSQLATQLKLVGWQVHRQRWGFEAIGPGIAIRVVAAGKRNGITEVDLQLRVDDAYRVVSLGRSQLYIDGRRARLAVGR